MQISPAAAIILSVLMLAGMRGFFALHLSSLQSRKAQKAYKANVPFRDRWFFLSALNYVRDKYSKLERKVIKARALVRTMRVMNFILHGLLLPEIAVILLHVFSTVDGTWGNRAFMAYIAVICIFFFVVCIVDMSNHREAERIRNGRKPSNW